MLRARQHLYWLVLCTRVGKVTTLPVDLGGCCFHAPVVGKMPADYVRVEVKGLPRGYVRQGALEALLTRGRRVAPLGRVVTDRAGLVVREDALVADDLKPHTGTLQDTAYHTSILQAAKAP